MSGTNIHIYPSPITHESRILKETETISNLGIVDEIYIIGLWNEGLLEEEVIDDKRKILRIKLLSRKLGEGTPAKSLKFGEWMFRIAVKFLRTRVILVNIHHLAALPIGGLFKIFKKARLIYDTHELETERDGWGSGRKILAKMLEKAWIRPVDEIIVVSPSIGEWYEKEYGKRTFTVFNASRYTPISSKDLLRKRLNIPNHKIIFLYQGALGAGRGIENIIEAFSKTKYPDKVIVFMGYGPLEEVLKEASNEYSNIYFHPAVKPDEVLDYTASADIGFALLENTCLSHYYSVPNKLFEYAMAEIPVVVPNFVEMKKLVEKYKIGYVIEDSSVQEISGLISKIDKRELLNFKRNLNVFNKVYNWEKQEETLSWIYEGS